KLPGDPVTEVRGPNFRNRQPSSRNHQRLAFEIADVAEDREGLVSLDVPNRTAHVNLNTGLRAFLQKKVDDLLRAAVAEELAEFLFMVSNAVPANDADKVLRRETRQGGFMKVRVAGNEIFRRRI